MRALHVLEGGKSSFPRTTAIPPGPRLWSKTCCQLAHVPGSILVKRGQLPRTATPGLSVTVKDCDLNKTILYSRLSTHKRARCSSHRNDSCDLSARTPGQSSASSDPPCHQARRRQTFLPPPMVPPGGPSFSRVSSHKPGLFNYRCDPGLWLEGRSGQRCHLHSGNTPTLSTPAFDQFGQADTCMHPPPK